MTIPREAVALIWQAEGYHRKLPDGRAAPYLCPANVPTIGLGSTFYEDGRRVTLADAPITRERAEALFWFEANRRERDVDRLCPGLPPLARGALVSFAYNFGSGALAASTLRRLINARRYSEVPRELARWRHAAGVVQPGLVRRRAAEADLFMRGVSLLGASDTRSARWPDAPFGWQTTVTG